MFDYKSKVNNNLLLEKSCSKPFNINVSDE